MWAFYLLYFHESARTAGGIRNHPTLFLLVSIPHSPQISDRGAPRSWLLPVAYLYDKFKCRLADSRVFLLAVPRREETNIITIFL